MPNVLQQMFSREAAPDASMPTGPIRLIECDVYKEADDDMLAAQQRLNIVKATISEISARKVEWSRERKTLAEQLAAGESPDFSISNRPDELAALHREQSALIEAIELLRHKRDELAGRAAAELVTAHGLKFRAEKKLNRLANALAEVHAARADLTRFQDHVLEVRSFVPSDFLWSVDPGDPTDQNSPLARNIRECRAAGYEIKLEK